MRFGDLLYETWHALSANKGRSLLTILGIVIGIAAVIAMTSLIGGIQNMLIGELGLAQARQVSISVSSPEPVDFDDVEHLAKGMPDYEILTGSGMTSVETTLADGTKSYAQIVAVKPDFFTANGSKVAEGRFFTASEEAAAARLALVDQSSVKELFGNADVEAVGKTLHLGNDDFTIVGVIESSSLMSYGVTVYLPYTTAETRVGGMYGVSQIIGFAREGTDMDRLTEATKSYVASYFNVSPEDGVYVYALDSMIKQMESMMASFSLLMGAVASISLFVGGIGIMNMMLTNVTERIREIGLRKSLGARRRDITKQFLLESIMLCVAGGVFGILFGFLAAWGLGGVIGMVQAGMTVTPVLAPGVVALAVGVCVLIGVVFGYYPARRAAKLDPVESLRYQ